MPRVIIKVVDGKLVMDLHGFQGEECAIEANKILEKMDVDPRETEIIRKESVSITEEVSN